GNVAGIDSRTRIRLGAFKAPLTASVDQMADLTIEDLLFGDDLAAALIRIERRFARAGLAALDWPALRHPFLESAIEDRDALGAKVAEHEPAATGGPDRRIVVDDDLVAAADAEALHRLAELRGTGQHVRRGIRMVADPVDIEEARSGDMRLEEL